MGYGHLQTRMNVRLVCLPGGKPIIVVGVRCSRSGAWRRPCLHSRWRIV